MSSRFMHVGLISGSSGNKLKPYDYEDFSFGREILMDFSSPIGDFEITPDVISHVGLQVEGKLNSLLTDDRACNLSMLSRIKNIEMTDRSVNLQFVNNSSTSYYGRDAKVDGCAEYITEEINILKQKTYSPDFSVNMMEGTAVDVANQCMAHYSKPPLIHQKARGIYEFSNKEHYFNLLTKLSSYEFNIENVLIVGSGSSPMVDYVRLEKSGFMDGGEKKFTFIDPELSVKKINRRMLHKNHQFSFYVSDFHDYVENAKKRVDFKIFDLILFPMSFHVVAGCDDFIHDIKLLSSVGTVILGIMPNPDIYDNPICAAINGCCIIDYDDDSQVYTVLNSATKSVFKEKKLNMDSLSHSLADGGFLMSYGSCNTYGLINTGIPGRVDASQTVLITYVPMDKYVLDQIKFSSENFNVSVYSMQWKKKNLGFFAKFVTNHSEAANKSSVLRTLGENVFYSPKLDGAEAILCLQPGGWAIQRADGYSISSLLYNDQEDRDKISLYFHVEVLSNDIVIIDLIYDVISSSLHGYNRADCAFVMRKIYLDKYCSMFGINFQNYVKQFSNLSIDTLNEGVIITPFNSSRAIFSGKKSVASGSCSVKNLDQLGFCVGVKLPAAESSVTLYLEYKMSDSGQIHFKSQRHNKTKNSIPNPETLTWDKFVEFSIGREDFRLAGHELIEQSIDFRFNDYVFRQLLADNYGVKNSQSYMPRGLVGLISELDHILGSDSCDVCSQYIKYIKTGHIVHETHVDHDVTLGFQRKMQNLKEQQDNATYNKNRLKMQKSRIRSNKGQNERKR